MVRRPRQGGPRVSATADRAAAPASASSPRRWSGSRSDGIDEVRIARIAMDAGVSTSLVHYHFETREALLEQALEYSYELRRRRPASARGRAPASTTRRPARGMIDQCLPTPACSSATGCCGSSCGSGRCATRTCARRPRASTRGCATGSPRRSRRASSAASSRPTPIPTSWPTASSLLRTGTACGSCSGTSEWLTPAARSGPRSSPTEPPLPDLPPVLRWRRLAAAAVASAVTLLALAAPAAASPLTVETFNVWYGGGQVEFNRIGNAIKAAGATWSGSRSPRAISGGSPTWRA